MGNLGRRGKEAGVYVDIFVGFDVGPGVFLRECFRSEVVVATYGKSSEVQWYVVRLSNLCMEEMRFDCFGRSILLIWVERALRSGGCKKNETDRREEHAKKGTGSRHNEERSSISVIDANIDAMIMPINPLHLPTHT